MDTNSTLPSNETLVDIHGLGPRVFGPFAPSERTLRQLTRKGIIPHFRIGKLVRYDPRLIRAALELHCLIQGKKAKKPTGGTN